MNNNDENKKYDELKDEGYKSVADKIWQMQFKSSLAQYESKMQNPYE